MYDNAELETTHSEQACRNWIHPRARISTSNSARPRLKRVRDGGRETWALVLTGELEGKVETALALGRSYIHGVQNVKKWKHELLLKQADNTGSLEAVTHRLNVKKLEIQPNKEPTELQKKILTSLAQGVERLKANQVVMDGTIATYDSKVTRGLDRWRKAWTDVDKILAKVWTDAGRLVVDGESDADDERPHRATESKNEVGRNGGPATIAGEDVPLAAPEAEPARQRQTGGRRSEISEWQNSVQAQSPTNLDKGRGVNTHHRHPTGRPYNNGDLQTSPSLSQHSSEHLRRSYRARAYPSRPPPPPPPPRHGHDVSMPSHARQQADDHDAHRERRNRSRSSSPGRERGTSRDAPEYRERNHRESQQHRTRDESARRIRSRNPPEDDRGGCGR